MSIQINGIDKPKSCFDCPCIDAEFEECAAREHYLLPKDEYGAVLGEVPDWCPITELPTCEDAVSRHAAIDALWKIRQEEISDGRRFHDYCSLSTAVDVIKDLPSAQSGKWIWSEDNASWCCSICGCVFEEIDWKPEYNYCPNCGADMRGEK